MYFLFLLPLNVVVCVIVVVILVTVVDINLFSKIGPCYNGCHPFWIAGAAAADEGDGNDVLLLLRLWSWQINNRNCKAVQGSHL